MLYHRKKLDSRLFELPLVKGGVVVVAGKAVQFMDDHAIERAIRRVLDHL